jgi:hypothetical protein
MELVVLAWISKKDCLWHPQNALLIITTKHEYNEVLSSVLFLKSYSLAGTSPVRSYLIPFHKESQTKLALLLPSIIPAYFAAVTVGFTASFPFEG